MSIGHPTYSSLVKRDRIALTLVELLVVITIIGILAALLLPGLSKSKGSALQTQCISQNRQIALAFQMYAHDNKDVMVWPNWANLYQGWLYTPTNGDPPAPSNPSEAVYAGGKFWPYLQNVKVYWCPVDYTNTPYFSKRLEQLSSYIMNGAILGYRMDDVYMPKTHKLAMMNPSAYLTWEPDDRPPYNPAVVYNDAASYPNDDEGPGRRHDGGCVVSAFDGHVQFLKFEIFLQEKEAQPGLLWCDPDTSLGTGGIRGRDCSLWK
jgi:prepilin-type processing-associated H-X9-DG protein